MAVAIEFVSTAEQRAAVDQLRYAVYVEELGYKHPGARIFASVDGQPQPGRMLIATERNAVIGTLTLDWGADADFTDGQYDAYDLAYFLRHIDRGQVIVVSDFIILPSHRKGDAPGALLDAMVRFALAHDVRLIFSQCRPHLLNTYIRLGFRPYTRTFNDPVAGLLVPVVLVLEDREHLERVSSRFQALVAERPEDPVRLAEVMRLVPDASAVQTLANPETAEEWDLIQARLTGAVTGQISLFQGLSEDEVARLLAMSHVIACRAGDRIVSEEASDRTVFVLLQGVVQVEKQGRVVAILNEGAVFGEVAFLLGSERTADVIAASDSRVLAIREKTLSELIGSESRIAARLLLNLARIVCLKVAGTLPRSQRGLEAPVGRDLGRAGWP